MDGPIVTALDASRPVVWQSATRYYAAWLTFDLFGSLVVCQRWGGRFNRRGRGCNHPVASRSEALAHLMAIARRRRSHRYHLCGEDHGHEPAEGLDCSRSRGA